MRARERDEQIDHIEAQFKAGASTRQILRTLRYQEGGSNLTAQDIIFDRNCVFSSLEA
jgi:hypothetical protein